MSSSAQPSMLPIEITLVVAATREMGIGLNGALPWTGLKKEMAYFARVTKRLPPTAQPSALNAVVMGRKTWESIPPRFRPLKGRLNVVISRSFTASPADPASTDTDAVQADSLERALVYLRGKPEGSVGKVFVIGGAQIYGAALGLPETRRVLLTRVLSDFKCDTFFPLQLSERQRGESGWTRAAKEDVNGWTGEEVPAGIQTENDTEYEFQMWTRVD